jgi:hypothetical protein
MFLHLRMIWSEKVYQLFEETERGASAMRIDRTTTDRKRRTLVDRVAVSVVLPLMLAACSSASSIDYSADAYPSQSLGDFLRQTDAQPTNASTATNASTVMNASTATNSSAAAANASTVAAPPNAGGSPPPPREDFDPLSAAYPSVPLSEIFSSSTKPAPR